jgi:hypothetical protein
MISSPSRASAPRAHALALVSRLALLGLLGVGGLAACAPVRRVPLSSPAVVTNEGLRAEVRSLSPTDDFLAQEGGALSLVAVTLTLTNAGSQSQTLELGRATLTFVDPGGELPDVSLAATLGGEGEAPSLVPLDARPTTVTLSPGQSAVVWIAFRHREPLPEPDLPRRIVVRLPEGGVNVSPTEIPIAEPATGRPRWVREPIRHASYAGIHAAGTFDEASFGIIRLAPRTAIGRFVFGPSVGVGFRGGQLRGESEGTVACCDLSVSVDASAQFGRMRGGSVGPYLGYHGLFALDRDRADRATWHGPSLGLRIFSQPIERKHATAMPVRNTPTVLGHTSLTLAYVHWFRRGDEGGSPGGILVLEHTTPPW